MEAPRVWREQKYRLNPNEHGYKPDMGRFYPENMENKQSISNQGNILDQSVLITLPISERDQHYAFRGVKPYSEMMKPEINQEEKEPEVQEFNFILIEPGIPSGIIYQEVKVSV